MKSVSPVHIQLEQTKEKEVFKSRQNRRKKYEYPRSKNVQISPLETPQTQTPK